MDQYDFDNLLHYVDQMIRTSEPRDREYYRGYRLGITLHRMGKQDDPPEEHFHHFGSRGGDGERHIGAYARGYCDGSKGTKPKP